MLIMRVPLFLGLLKLLCVCNRPELSSKVGWVGRRRLGTSLARGFPAILRVAATVRLSSLVTAAGN